MDIENVARNSLTSVVPCTFVQAFKARHFCLILYLLLYLGHVCCGEWRVVERAKASSKVRESGESFRRWSRPLSHSFLRSQGQQKLRHWTGASYFLTRAHHWTCCCCRFHDRWSVRQLSPARRLSAAALGDEGPPYTEVQKLLTGLFERTGIVWWARDRIAGCVMDARFHLGVGVFNFLLSFLERVCCS